MVGGVNHATDLTGLSISIKIRMRGDKRSEIK
jgi:hypothetical protein